MPSRKPALGEVLSGFVLALLSVYIISAALSWSVYGDMGPGPGFFPLFYAAVMLPTSLWLMLRGMRGGGPVKPAPTDPEDVAPDDGLGGGTQAAFATWIALALTVPVMSLAGFVPGCIGLSFFVAKIVFRKSLKTSLIAAASIALGLYVLFQVLLDIDLPPGLLGRR
jgi:putative tricarboxylic transport membrane protein